MKKINFIKLVKKIFTGIALACILHLTSCDIADIQSDQPYQRVTAEKAKKIMDNLDSYVLLDVRTEEEFLDEHIEGALLITDYNIATKAEELINKDAVILVYCRSGRRSANASNELLKMGYTRIYDFGGIADWPYDTVSGKVK